LGVETDLIRLAKDENDLMLSTVGEMVAKFFKYLETIAAEGFLQFQCHSLIS
jgi:hypothetical protein